MSTSEVSISLTFYEQIFLTKFLYSLWIDSCYRDVMQKLGGIFSPDMSNAEIIQALIFVSSILECFES